MNDLVLNEIIVIVNDEMRQAHIKLEFEESGREVAALQGHVAGYKLLLSYLSAEFHLVQTILEDNGERPMVIPDMSDDELAVFNHDVESFKGLEEWRRVLNKIDERTEDLKNHLLFGAEKTRDLDISQGTYKGMTVFSRLFNAVEHEVERREEKKEKEKKEMPLFKDDEESPIEPVIDDDEEEQAVADNVTAFHEV
jgi:hypothetical protein